MRVWHRLAPDCTKTPVSPVTAGFFVFFGNQKLVEITHEDLRALTDAISWNAAHRLQAVHSREVILQVVYRWAIERAQKVGFGHQIEWSVWLSDLPYVRASAPDLADTKKVLRKRRESRRLSQGRSCVGR
ncbi:hypothetical protein [Nitrosomonas sp. wSCUT-2]